MRELTEPTNLQPGSEEKIRLLMRRAELELPLHVPGDRGTKRAPGGGDRSCDVLRSLAV